MVKIGIYLAIFLLALLSTLFFVLSGKLPDWLTSHQEAVFCSICGGFGGVLYCLRGLYINYSLRKNWDQDWHIWYILRPIVSIISGTISFLFVKAGLLAFEAQPVEGSSNLGFYALAFIAGLNVDKFISKIEDLAQATWGIEKSRASKIDADHNAQNPPS